MSLSESLSTEVRQLRQRFSVAVWFSTLLLSACPILAWHAGYSPGYEPFPMIPLAPLDSCERQAESSSDTVLYSCNGRTVREFEISSTRQTIEIRSGDTKLASSRLPTPIQGPIYEAHTVDLNNDGRADFIMVMTTMGVGLRSEDCFVLFALSSESAYRLAFMESLGFGVEDVIAYYGDRRYQVIHTDLISGVGQDGSRHNYWVYSFLEPQGDDLRESAAINSHWIMYSIGPNHTPTTQLTEDKKRKLWAAQHAGFFVKDEGH